MDINDQIEENIPFVHYILNKYFPNIKDDEDILQIGTIGLWKALKTYDSSKNIKFSTYAYNVISNEIGQELRKVNKWNNLPTISIENKPFEDSDVTYSDMLIDPNNDYNLVEMKILFSNLDKKSSEILRLTLLGYSQRAICKMLNCSQPTVSRRLKKIQELLKD